jgi:hypothetical protein
MIFALLTLLSALSLAVVADWFSIIGFLAIYAAAPFHAIVMGIVLASAKIVTTSWLYRNWKFADWRLKVPLICFVIMLMAATSIGTYGFLTKSHLDQGGSTIDNSAKVERLDQQIARDKTIIVDDEKVIAQLDATINSYIGKDRTDKSLAVRRSQAPQRKQLRDDIDASQKRIDGFSDEKLKLQSEVRKQQLDVGPIRYIAELFYGVATDATQNIESAVRIFTLLIVSTLDPLAVILLIAANHTLLRLKDEKAKELPSQVVGVTLTSAIIPDRADKDENNTPSTIKEDVATSSHIESPPTQHKDYPIHIPVLQTHLDSLETVNEKEENLSTQELVRLDGASSRTADITKTSTEGDAEVSLGIQIPTSATSTLQSGGPVHIQILQTPLEQISEEIEVTENTIISTPSEIRAIWGDDDSDEAITLGTPATILSIQEIQAINEKETPVMAELSLPSDAPSFAVIRQPHLTRVSSREIVEPVLEPEIVNKEAPIQTGPVITPVSVPETEFSRGTIINELLGTSQHFIPQKITEQAPIITTNPLFQKYGNIDRISTKYPSVLSWLSEFKRP